MFTFADGAKPHFSLDRRNVHPKDSYFSGSSWVSPAPSTKPTIDPNGNRRILRMRWNSLALKWLLGFSASRKLQRAGGQPSGYEISGLNNEEVVLSLETLQLVFPQRTRRDEIYQPGMCRFTQGARFA